MDEIWHRLRCCGLCWHSCCCHMEESQWGGCWHWLSLTSKGSIRLCEVCLTQRQQSHPSTRLKSEYSLGYLSPLAAGCSRARASFRIALSYNESFDRL